MMMRGMGIVAIQSSGLHCLGIRMAGVDPLLVNSAASRGMVFRQCVSGDMRPMPITSTMRCKVSVLYSKCPSMRASRRKILSELDVRRFGFPKLGTMMHSLLQGNASFVSLDLKEATGLFESLEGDESSDIWLIDEVETPFNHISVIELGSQADHKYAGSYVLKLDEKDLIHSVSWHDERVWTDAYFDEFAMLPPLLPPGPIGILGLGAGTVARLLLHVWPSRQLEGWEIDPEVVSVGRAYFGLSKLEGVRKKDKPRSILKSHVAAKRTTPRPNLTVHVGDALCNDSEVQGRFAGLVVDLYSHGRICDRLKESSTWSMLRKRLQPGGRIMVNCGGPPVMNGIQEDTVAKEWLISTEATAAAMSSAFDGDINIKQLNDEGRNVMLLSGHLPALEDWSVRAPTRLIDSAQDWRPHLGEFGLTI